jgi:electron transport complex protein RnfA
MSSGFAWLAFLMFFSSLSVNFILQCGLGMAGITRPAAHKLPLLKTGLGFITVLILWLFFYYILSPLSMGFFGYILFFPVSSLVYCALEFLVFTVLLKNTSDREDSFFLNDGLLGAALFVTYSISSGFLEAFVMICGFSAGMLMTLVIIGEIHRRSEMEAVPKYLRGSPLILISMGLLSLVFSSVSMILYKTLGN